MVKTLLRSQEAEAWVVESVSEHMEKLIDDHQARVWRYLRALGCSPHEADDLTQETFLAVLRKPFEYLGDSAAAGYLRKVAYHLFISNRRRKNLEVIVEDLERCDRDWTRLQGDDQGAQLLDALTDCLECLPERSRRSLEMRFRDRLPRSEIAAALSLSECGAKNLMQRAKHKLRDCVERKIRHEAGNATPLTNAG